MENKYEDIINLEHHVSTKHPQMSLNNRAAQFASFAALTGYEDEIEETARLTDRKIELEDEEKLILNNTIKEINENINDHPNILITYFVPDLKKEGGRYITIQGKVKKIDDFKKSIILENNKEIIIQMILDIKILK